MLATLEVLVKAHTELSLNALTCQLLTLLASTETASSLISALWVCICLGSCLISSRNTVSFYVFESLSFFLVDLLLVNRVFFIFASWFTSGSVKNFLIRDLLLSSHLVLLGKTHGATNQTTTNHTCGERIQVDRSVSLVE